MAGVAAAELLAMGTKKENTKSAVSEASSLLERYGVNYVDKGGNTLLHRLACSMPACIYVLVSRGVPVNVQNNLGDTALHLAVRQDRFDCAEALIQCSADLSIRNGVGQMPIDEAKGPVKEMLERCRPGPVQAVLRGNSSVLRKHLQQNWGSVLSIVQCGVVAALEAGNGRLLVHLLRLTWASLTSSVKNGKNLIHLARSMDNSEPKTNNCYRILLEYRNTSELIHSVLSEDVNKLEQFLAEHQGFSVNVRFRDRYGKTLLSHAIDSNNLEMVKLLVKAGARISQIRVRDRGRSTETMPLFFRALRKDINPEIPQFLHSVQDPTEMLEKDTRGNTALLYAIEEGVSEQIISWLIVTQNGLNILQRTKESLNARELAEFCERPEVVALIDKFVLQQRKKFFLTSLPVHFYGQENLQFVDESSGKTFKEVVAEGYDENDRKSVLLYKNIEDRGVRLFEAAAQGNLEQVKQLCLANFQDKNGYTAMIRAIVFNQPEVISYLCIFRPVLKTIPDNCNRYPLHYAFALPEEQDKVFIRILLERDPELLEKRVDKDGRYPVEYGKMRGTASVEQMLHDARTLDAYGVRGPPLGPWPEGLVSLSPTCEQ